MITVKNAVAPSWFSLDSDTKFMLQPLSSLGKMELLSHRTDKGIRFGRDATDAAISECLIGWSGVEDENHQPLEFVSARHALLVLDTETLSVIISEIFQRAFLSEEDKKKL